MISLHPHVDPPMYTTFYHYLWIDMGTIWRSQTDNLISSHQTSPPPERDIVDAPNPTDRLRLMVCCNHLRGFTHCKWCRISAITCLKELMPLHLQWLPGINTQHWNLFHQIFRSSDMLGAMLGPFTGGFWRIPYLDMWSRHPSLYRCLSSSAISFNGSIHGLARVLHTKQGQFPCQTRMLSW